MIFKSSGSMGRCLNMLMFVPPVLPVGTDPTIEPTAPSTNARSLPEYCGGLATMNRNPEHEPVRQHVWGGVLLAEDMSPLKMNERLVVLVSAHESSGQRDLFLEGVALDWIHGSSSCEQVYPFARTSAWSPFLAARTILVLCVWRTECRSGEARPPAKLPSSLQEAR